MTKISDIGEFGFIDAIKDHTLFHPENVAVGIGDDGAVYTTTPGWQQVAVIDTMVQNSHFIIGQTATWHDVGFKAVASNLSDIAAMGAVPTLRRSGAQAGDVIAVSHTIGDSAGGLDVLLAGQDGYEHLKKAHQYPEPQISLGRLLVQHHCHSLNDISDGLASESNEIAKASGVELVIDRDQVPTSAELKAWAAASGKDIWKFVFNGGEDYELVFTMAPDDFQALQAVYPAVTPIGTVRQGPGRVLLRHDGGEQVLPPTGWTHF